jgi:hypothetical protein
MLMEMPLPRTVPSGVHSLAWPTSSRSRQMTPAGRCRQTAARMVRAALRMGPQPTVSATMPMPIRWGMVGQASNTG